MYYTCIIQGAMCKHLYVVNYQPQGVDKWKSSSQNSGAKLLPEANQVYKPKVLVWLQKSNLQESSALNFEIHFTLSIQSDFGSNKSYSIHLTQSKWNPVSIPSTNHEFDSSFKFKFQNLEIKVWKYFKLSPNKVAIMLYM